MMQNSQENRLYSLRSPDAHRLPAENPKKNVLKTYNPKLHNFGYEHQQKQKNTGNEVYAEKSTPSDISTQSVLENNDDIFHVIPTLKHLLILAECQSFDSIGINEYYSLLSILKIRQACEGISGPPKYFKLQNATDQIKMEDFVAFFTSDVQDLDITKYSREELVLKFGLEIFRAMSKENIFLELRDLVNYIKEHNKLDVDLTSMLEIFDFFTDPDQGMLKTRTTLIDFFHKNALRLARALSMDFLNQLRRLTENKKTDGATTTRKEENVVEGENKGSNIIKIYDSTVKCNLKNRPPTMINIGANNKEENGRDLEKVGQGQINFDKNLLDMDHQFFKLGISEVFQEILPKNRGWLMRKSNRYENKWSMVFFEVKDNKLISTKPTSLKKSIDVKSIEIHKCNLLEVMKRFDPSQDSKKGIKKGTSHSRVPSKKDVRLTTFTKMDQEKPDYLFFIIDKATHKTYLIKSPDNLIIGSIIRFYIMKDLQTYNGGVQLPASEPEYSGVIEIAVCKKSCIHKYHSSLKSYSFRKQFLIIKHGKFNIYEMKTKDSFDLLDYETKTHSDYDLLPQTNQYIFSLEKMSNLPHDLVSKRPLAAKSMMPIQEVEPFSTERVKTLPYLTSPKFNQDPINFGTPQIHYEDLKVIEYKNNATSKGFFSSIIHKIQSTIKKDSKIVLACDTELKRRQWVLTLKFFSQLAQSALFRSSFTKDSGVSAQEDSHTLKNSFQTEYNHSLPDNAGSRTKHKKKPSSISIKHKATYNPDFIDVYKAEDKGEQQEGEQEQEQEHISPRDIEVGTNNKRSFPLVTEPDVKPNTNRKNLPLITEPDASQHFDSEELLMTFQFGESLPFMMTKNNTLNNRIIDNFENEKLLFSNEIKSMSDVEIWQRFLTFFMQEKHSCAEFDLNNAGEDESTELVLGQDTEELEEDASIRQVVVSDFSVNKRS